MPVVGQGVIVRHGWQPSAISAATSGLICTATHTASALDSAAGLEGPTSCAIEAAISTPPILAALHRVCLYVLVWLVKRTHNRIMHMESAPLSNLNSLKCQAQYDKG